MHPSRQSHRHDLSTPELADLIALDIFVLLEVLGLTLKPATASKLA